MSAPSTRTRALPTRLGSCTPCLAWMSRAQQNCTLSMGSRLISRSYHLVCAFVARCAYAIDRCQHDVPALSAVAEGHLSACWVAETLGSEARR